jgi:hypothetical protein
MIEGEVNPFAKYSIKKFNEGIRRHVMENCLACIKNGGGEGCLPLCKLN